LLKQRFDDFYKWIIKANIRFYGIWIGLVLLCLILSLATNNFLTVSNLTNVCRQVSVNIILACGMTIVIISGGIDLSVGSILAFSGVLMASVMLRYGMVLGIVTAVLAGAVLGFINGMLIFRRKSLAFVVTLGTMTIWRSITAIYTGGLPYTNFSDDFLVIGSGDILFIPIPFIIAIAVALISVFLLNRTKYGKYLYAIGSNAEAARNCGVSTNAVITVAYTICGLMAAIAGIVFSSRLNSAQSQGGLGYEMDVIAAVVIGGTSLSGGRGKISGTIAGAFLMGLLRNGLNLLNVTANWQQTVIGIVIIAVVLWDKGGHAAIVKDIRKGNTDIL